MSIEVPLDELGDAVAAREFCYLLTVSDDDRPHLLALRPTVEQLDDGVRLGFEVGGGRASRNAAARPHVTLVFPPVEAGGMSLVVDGTAAVDGGSLGVTATWAVLHRPAP